MKSTGEKFDRAYYHRYYVDPKRKVATRGEIDARGAFVAAFVRYSGMPVKRVLDAGCGLGLLRRSLKRGLPQAEYVGLEVSPYVARKHGWHQGSIVDWRSRHTYELVICYDVLQYLDDRDAARALANLARLCSGILYFSTLTIEDWRHIADRSKTDKNAHLRSAAWYRRMLGRHFRECGAGFWIRRGANVVLWSLEAAERVSRRAARKGQA